VRAGVDWLEAGTPLILAEGLHVVRALRQHFPDYPIVADLKTMDGGYLEVEMMAKAGATHCVVMGVAHPATITACVRAGRDFGVKIMGDVLAAADKPACARRLQELGCDYIIVHTGFDERREVLGGDALGRFAGGRGRRRHPGAGGRRLAPGRPGPPPRRRRAAGGGRRAARHRCQRLSGSQRR